MYFGRVEKVYLGMTSSKSSSDAEFKMLGKFEETTQLTWLGQFYIWFLYGDVCTISSCLVKASQKATTHIFFPTADC